MIPKSDIESALHVRTIYSSDMAEAVKLWAAMYADSPPWKSSAVKTLNMPAAIAGKLAKMVTLEAELTITGSARAGWLLEQVAPTWAKIRNLTEQAAAKGGMVFKPYLAQGRVLVDCVQADRFFPTAFDEINGMTGSVFVAQKVDGNVIYTRLEQHEYKNGVQTITHRAYRSQTAGMLGSPIPLTSVPEWAEIQPETTISGLERPLFVYWKMPSANNIDDTSPLGVSVYAKATEIIEQIDRQYGRFLWEYESGERAIHASADLFKQVKGTDGKLHPVLPKGHERLYRDMYDSLEDGKNFFEEYSPEFRDSSIIAGLNVLLRQVEQKCGLAYGTFSDPQAVERTAEEVRGSKQETFTTVSDIQKSLEIALEQLLISIGALGDAVGIAPKGSYDVAFTWDDSIINDPAEKKKQYWSYVMAGKYPAWRYFMEFEGYTEEEAKAIQAETSQIVGDPYAIA